MFKRLTTSISHPPQTVFFMKDSWKRIVLYVLLLPILLIIPTLIQLYADPSMNLRRYELLTQAVKDDFRTSNASIVDGTLTYEAPVSANFDTIFYLYLGDQNIPKNLFLLGNSDMHNAQQPVFLPLLK